MQLGECCKCRESAENSSSGGQQRPDLVHFLTHCATGNGKHEKVLHRRMARMGLPFRKIILAAARENSWKGVENREDPLRGCFSKQDVAWGWSK